MSVTSIGYTRFSGYIGEGSAPVVAVERVRGALHVYNIDVEVTIPIVVGYKKPMTLSGIINLLFGGDVGEGNRFRSTEGYKRKECYIYEPEPRLGHHVLLS